MSIVVCGAAGQVGFEVTRRAPGAIALGRQELDISDAAAVDRVMDALRPRVVINAAAYTAVDKAESDADSARRINADGPRYLARACARHGAALLHLSTDYVFNGDGGIPWMPDSAAAPLGVYGLTKLEGEQGIREELAQHMILRVAWVFGPHGVNFVRTMVRAAGQRPELRVVSDQIGGPTYAGDIADTLLLLAGDIAVGRARQWGTYHYCGAPTVSWHAFAKTIIERAVRHGLLTKEIPVIPISTAEYPTPARRPHNSVLDCSVTLSVLGIAQPDWRVGLEETLKIWKSEQS
ncbi:dTDP-4-dehydrorhamnose reductase [Solimonas variicoloris]|uniref:dTDP-4-dehydrorhamnose reductase n=1 Tax=Solimonas variicoloris TaxID=254408 RepID=UPI0004754404|nr:dTDP-4-dehydrorhamnose reductase [Solimonas variicoloris]